MTQMGTTQMSRRKQSFVASKSSTHLFSRYAVILATQGGMLVELFSILSMGGSQKHHILDHATCIVALRYIAVKDPNHKICHTTTRYSLDTLQPRYGQQPASLNVLTLPRTKDSSSCGINWASRGSSTWNKCHNFLQLPNNRHEMLT